DYFTLTLQFNNVEKVFFMLSNTYEPKLEKNVKAICDSRDIVLIPSRLMWEQIIELIELSINPSKEKNSNVFTFFSSIGNVGTTSTCLSVGQILQKHTNAKIGVLLLNAWDDGTDQIDYKGSYLDDIKSKLSGQLIQSESEFLSCFHMMEKDSLYILGGNRNTRMERLFTKEEIHYLIQKSKEIFDIVLIDCGCHFDNAVMVQSLMESDLRFLVVNQQSKAIKKFNYIYNDVLYPLGYKHSDFLMVINQYQDEVYLPSSKEINKEINVPMITAIERNQYGILSEQEQKILISYNDELYRESIIIIAKSISSKVNIDFIQGEEKKKKRYFGR
ncbi:hypothetical protein, partial [Heyndrickxia sporothermodurans]|uniref:hypothetical protein n=1 Tax=Heyndrickxia sporothermodurans TaxID=46224 RepID=UPI0014762F78